MTAQPTPIETAEAKAPQAGFVLIPLNKLAISECNIRRTDRKVDLDALAASIKSLGLLQNLTVTASAWRVETPLMSISATASMTARTERRPRPSDC
jgi:hypothetical protein